MVDVLKKCIQLGDPPAWAKRVMGLREELDAISFSFSEPISLLQ
jgi:hypothetical protein